MEAVPKRLYIVTGKGGVGKTTLSKAFVRYLTEHDHEAIYLTFKGQALNEKSGSTESAIRGGIKEVALDLEECARGYVEKKLNSKIIAAGVVKTPFFRALINMIPGFNYLIYLGKILEMGKENPRLVVVLDAPASGHALTMVESTTNFQSIFESGAIFDDTAKMLARLNDPEYTKIHVISLPSLMSWQEATELRTGLRARTPVDVEISLNNCLFPLLENELDSLPESLRQKTRNEMVLVEEYRAEMRCVLPHSLSEKTEDIESDLLKHLSKLL